MQPCCEGQEDTLAQEIAVALTEVYGTAHPSDRVWEHIRRRVYRMRWITRTIRQHRMASDKPMTSVEPKI